MITASLFIDNSHHDKQMEMDYTASYDSLTKGMTAGVILLFIVIGCLPLWPAFANQADQQPAIVGILIGLLFIAILAGSYIFSTQRYTLSGKDLIIRRVIKDVVIHVEDITEIRPLDRSELSGAIRTFASGGLFGYFGKFYSTSLGHMTWYVTQRNKVVLIRTSKGSKIIISPDDLRLVEDIQALQRKRY
jgi:hypothetical protein